MKIIIPTLFILSIIILAGCTVKSEQSQQTETQITGASPTNVHELTLEIEGMTCESCAYGVEYQLKNVDGVLDAKASYQEGKGYITYDADKVDSDTIAEASDVYPAKVINDQKKQ